MNTSQLRVGVLATSLVLWLCWACVPAAAADPLTSQAQSSQPVRNEALADEITSLFNQDQAFLGELERVKQAPALQQTWVSYKERIVAASHNPNFYIAPAYDLWAANPDAPETVRRYVTFHAATNVRLKAIVAQGGWPTRTMVGNVAAAQFFFLFGHADDENPWRLTQLGNLERVFKEDHVNPRMYAHLRDRLADVSGEPQIYGTIMGPDFDIPGKAKLYWKLVDNEAAADRRRADIGLPSIEDDLQAYREGAHIDAFMTPAKEGTSVGMSDVYKSGSIKSGSLDQGR